MVVSQSVAFSPVTIKSDFYSDLTHKKELMNCPRWLFAIEPICQRNGMEHLSVMTWKYTIKLTDVAIVLATISGTIFAVQSQKWLERHRSVQERRLFIFRTLMSTHAAVLSPGHV
jgi:hypothetical protein